jgi:hypothetical protein
MAKAVVKIRVVAGCVVISLPRRVLDASCLREGDMVAVSSRLRGLSVSMFERPKGGALK